MNSGDTDAHIRTDELMEEQSNALMRRTDRLFAGLMLFQYVAGIAAAFVITPRTWIGTQNEVHVHVWAAILLGGLITGFPVLLAIYRPGATITRHAIAIGQGLTSAILIHLCGGRIETHFHVFGSLAFLSFYRDWRVLITASFVIAVDHFVRGVFWPQSAYGIASASQWRWLEHAAWVVFEDAFLIRCCITGRQEMFGMAERQAHLEITRSNIEAEVVARTADLQSSNEMLTQEIHERAVAERQRDELNVQLAHAQKLESIGQLAAGIAHEINTPIQFVGDNTRFLQESFSEITPLLDKAHKLVTSVRNGSPDAGLADELEQAIEDADISFLVDEIPVSIEQSLGGIARVRKLVQSMKEFSHPGGDEMTCVDINRAIESTIDVATNEWKYVANMETRLDPELPPLSCLPGEINQAVLNIIVNASHAIVDAQAGSNEKGTITISTSQSGGFAEIRISDTGTGIPVHAQDKIFDPFFTTKEVGKGTGQGLAISYSAITQKHNGTLHFETEAGVGTTFIIRLPIESAVPEEVSA